MTQVALPTALGRGLRFCAGRPGRRRSGTTNADSEEQQVMFGLNDRIIAAWTAERS